MSESYDLLLGHTHSTFAGTFWTLTRVVDMRTEATNFPTEAEAREWATTFGHTITAKQPCRSLADKATCPLS